MYSLPRTLRTGVAAGSYRITVRPLEQGDTTTTGRYQIKILELRQANEQEIKASKNQDVVKAKGIALLAEIEGTIPEIKSPFTHSRSAQDRTTLVGL